MGEEESVLKYDVMMVFLLVSFIIGWKIKKKKKQNIVDREQSVVHIDLDDLAQFEDSRTGTVANIIRNTKHYVDFFASAIDDLCALKTPTNPDLSYKDSVLDVIIRQRSIRDSNRTSEADDSFPPSLTRR